MGNTAREWARLALVIGMCNALGCGTGDEPGEGPPDEADTASDLSEATPLLDKQSTSAWLPGSIPLPLLDGQCDTQYQRAPLYPIRRVVRGSRADASDLRAGWRAIHDSIYLYLCVDVQDDVVMVDSDPSIPWEDDAVEVFLNFDGSTGRRYDGFDDVHLIFRPGDRRVHFGLRSASLAPDALAVAQKRLPDGYQLELAIPWSALQARWPINKTIAMDVHVDDDDDGGDRERKVSWSSHDDEAWQRPDRFGRVKLERGGDRAYFAGLGDLPGGAHGSVARDLTGDGEWIVGSSESAVGTQAVRWSIYWGLIVLNGGPSAANAISPDGAYIVGNARDAEDVSAGVLWHHGQLTFLRGGSLGTPGAPPLFTMPTPTRVRNDGVVFGSCLQHGAFTPIGCRYDGPEQIRLVPPFSAIYAADAADNLGGSRNPARLEPIGQVAILNGVELGYPQPSTCITPHQCRSEVRDFSQGAAIAVGLSQVPGLTNPAYFDAAFTYTQAEGMRRLPDYPGGADASGAYAISDDGRIIAGFGTSEGGKRAIVWVDKKPVAIEALVRAAGNEVPAGWRLTEVHAMSADGRIFAGDGINPKGQVEAFMVWLPRAP